MVAIAKPALTGQTEFMNATPTAPRGGADGMTRRQVDQAVDDIVRQAAS
jgi:hypothetical protein